MLTVACVLRSGPEYQVEHVDALCYGVGRNLRMPHRFVCLTDLWRQVSEAGIEAVPLQHGWPGWWSKIELFRPDLFEGPVFYLDLDTIVVGPITDLVLGHRFTVLRNFWSDQRIGSGLMAWDADLSVIYNKFVETAQASIRTYRTKELWGDQGFIKVNTPVTLDLWQLLHPGRIISYKRDYVEKRGIPPAASIICYHGLPRPWKTPLWRQYRRNSDDSR